jgi:SAM-dependent methyltransferase
MTAEGVARQTLELFAETPRLNRWLYAKLAPFVTGDVLEIGSGLGTLSRFIVAGLGNAERAVLSDAEPAYLQALAAAFAGDARVAVARYDLDGPPPPAIASRQFDTILAVNVVEHIADDRALCGTLAAMLAPGGRLVVYVPACPFAFGPLDRALGHHRRYSPATLHELLARAGLRTSTPRYVNLAGLVGWVLAGKLMARERLGRGLLELFERLMPLIAIEDRVRLPVGLGLYAVAERTTA